jgi:hypothetical protein
VRGSVVGPSVLRAEACAVPGGKGQQQQRQACRQPARTGPRYRALKPVAGRRRPGESRRKSSDCRCRADPSAGGSMWPRRVFFSEPKRTCR